MNKAEKNDAGNGHPLIAKARRVRTGKFIKLPHAYTSPSHEYYHVISRDSRWIVRREGAEKAYGIYDTKNEAIREALQIAHTGKGHAIYIHGKDGKVLEKRTFGSFPS